MDDFPEYEGIKEEAQRLYADTKPVESPTLDERVVFTAEGFNHILFKGSRSEREYPSQIMRFKLLPSAIRLIAPANTFQEYGEVSKEFEVKKRKHRERRNKNVRCWGIIAIFEGRKIKVILRKIADGKLHFWSIVPAWTTNKTPGRKFRHHDEILPSAYVLAGIGLTPHRHIYTVPEAA